MVSSVSFIVDNCLERVRIRSQRNEDVQKNITICIWWAKREGMSAQAAKKWDDSLCSVEIGVRIGENPEAESEREK